MSHYAGLDWSKFKSGSRDLRLAVLAAVNDPEQLADIFNQVLTRHNQPLNRNFHGYDDGPEIHLALLKAVKESNLELRVGAVIYDFSKGETDQAQPADSTDFMFDIGIVLFERFLPVFPLSECVCDKDINGKKRQDKFKVEVKRLNRNTSQNQP